MLVITLSLWLAGCLTMPKPVPPLALTPATYIDAIHPVWHVVTNVAAAAPAPVGVPSEPITNVARYATLAAPVAQMAKPAPTVTNVIYVALYIPPDGQNQTTNPAMLQVQATTDFKTWRTIATVRQLSGTNATARLLSTNAHTFYRTLTTQDAIAGVGTH